jgi:hypothetical protein
MNSLYLWTNISPPDRALIGSELNLFTPDEQLGIIRSLLSHARPMVVMDTLNMPSDSKPMTREINQRFRRWRQIGQYILLVPKGNLAPERPAEIGK